MVDGSSTFPYDHADRTFIIIEAFKFEDKAIVKVSLLTNISFIVDSTVDP